MCPIYGCDRSYSHPSSMRKHMKTHGAASKGVPFPSRIEDISGKDIKSEYSDSDESMGSPNLASSPCSQMPAFIEHDNSTGSANDSGHETFQNSPEHSKFDNAHNGYFPEQNFPYPFMGVPNFATQFPLVTGQWDHYGPDYQQMMVNMQADMSSYWPVGLQNQYWNQNEDVSQLAHNFPEAPTIPFHVENY